MPAAKGAAKGSGGKGAAKGGGSPKAKKDAKKSKKASSAGGSFQPEGDTAPSSAHEVVDSAAGVEQPPTGDPFLDKLQAAEARDTRTKLTLLEIEQGVGVVVAG